MANAVLTKPNGEHSGALVLEIAMGLKPTTLLFTKRDEDPITSDRSFWLSLPELSEESHGCKRQRENAMQHSVAASSAFKPTSHLPQYVSSSPLSLKSSRQALSASISAATLLQASQNSSRDHKREQARVSVAGFQITDLLEPSALNRKSDLRLQEQLEVEPTASSKYLSTLLPLSPIKQVHPESLGGASGSSQSPFNIFAESSEHQHRHASEQKQQSQYLQRLDDPENVELFAYASTFCYRITGKYLPKVLLQSDPSAQKLEIERIQRDPEILKAIATIRTLSKQFKDVARDTMGHRKELGHTLFRIEENYLKLFEKLMEISLRMYWKYEQVHSAFAFGAAELPRYMNINDHIPNRSVRVSARRTRRRSCTGRSSTRRRKPSTKLKKLIEGKDIVLTTQHIQLRDLEQQLDEVNVELKAQRGLEHQVRELTRVEDELRSKDRQLHEDLSSLQMREQQKRIMDEMRHTMREKDALIRKQDAAIRELSVEPTPVVFVANSTQTEVDDDGLWDTQDGIPRYISKNALHRMLWRRFNAFVTCKNCRGIPIATNKKNAGGGVGRGLLQEGDQDYTEVWSIERREKTTKKEAKRVERIEQQWQLPPPILLFLSNLPKSVVAFPFYPLAKVISQIEEIYDDKFASDQVDASDGVAREELSKFICEFFLKTHGLRQSAEVALYRLLISIKSLYRRNSHVKLFARFLNLLQDDDEDSHLRDTINDRNNKSPKKHTNSSNGSTTSQAPSKKKRSGYLNMSFLHVFLTARCYLQRPPPTQSLPKSKCKGSAQAQAQAPTRAPETPHVVQLEPTKKWVSLDHAITILKWYISYLPEESIVSYCREVEYSTGIYAGGVIIEVSGNRLAVRAEMRRAMLGSEANESNNNTLNATQQAAESEKDKKRIKPRIVADVHKVLLLLLDALEQRQEVMEKDLIALFDAGDTNHDCVLSFTEFKAIIKTRMPHFSDRRVLRMFREALMGGADQSFALSMAAFVLVCGDHGLVSLLPDDRLQDPFQSPKKVAKGLLGSPSEDTSVKSAIKLSAALDALVSPTKRRQIADTPTDPVSILELPGNTDILEELPMNEEGTEMPSARAEEVEDGETWE